MSNSFCLSLLLIVSLLYYSCKTNEADAILAEEDTRILVKAAIDSIDPMAIPVGANKMRVAIIKNQFDNEKDPGRRINLGLQYALELLRNGETTEALNVYSAATNFIAQNNFEMDAETKRNLYSFIGITFMRHGEIENCLKNHNHESCIIPIKGEGVHQLPYGSSNAISIYEKSLAEFPDDLETKYLLNLAYMTLGQYPDKVPAKYRIDPSWFSSKTKMKPFEDIAAKLGINVHGLAGGTVIDDFDNDGWLDIVVTSWAFDEELIFYKNNGNGSFSDQTQAMNLKGHVCILNLHQTDFNNDGLLDLHFMRGAWLQREGDMPSTLLMNTGNGFKDVTVKAGLLRYSPTQASAWADYNLDGWVDLVVAYESLPDLDIGVALYVNQKDGTFKEEAVAAGVHMNKFFKGCIAADVNNDKFPDLYFSSIGSDNLLFINQGSTGTPIFKISEFAQEVAEPISSFPTWNFDFDNDGNEDIFVSGYSNDATPAVHWMKSKAGKVDAQYLPRLYRNTGDNHFQDVGQNMGLNEVTFTMGCNFGDFNTDGFLDFYLGTGNPLYQSLVPNKAYLNIDGKRFEDVSYSGGFANIQKGHGVSFGDLDRDGDEDIYASIGGAYEGDDFYNTLLENPNENQNNWIVLKLEGKTANRMAIGARVIIEVIEGGVARKLYRTVTSGSSFGGNSLALEVGLRKATAVRSVVVKWPCQNCPDQTFTDMSINSAYKLVQDEPKVQPLQYTSVKLGANASPGAHHHQQH